LTRIVEIFFCIILLIILLPFLLIIFTLIKLDSNGPTFFISNRVGKEGIQFKMIKFRTMFVNTEIVESNRIEDVNLKITKIGKILRRYSIDEIPQLFNIIKGEMSFVGYRPSLLTQYELNEKRKHLNINKFKPGITGLAQISGRDLISIEKKIELENEYLIKKNFLFDLIIVLKTIKVVLVKKGISH